MRAGPWVIWLAVGMLALGAGVWSVWRGPQAETPPALQALQLKALDGAPRRLSDWPRRPLVLNFWASWCEPCRREMPLLDAAAQRYGDRVQFIGVAWEPWQGFATYARQGVWHFPLLLAAEGVDVGAILAELGDSSRALPFSVVLDGQGRLHATQLGAWPEARLYSVLDGLTSERR